MRSVRMANALFVKLIQATKQKNLVAFFPPLSALYIKDRMKSNIDFFHLFLYFCICHLALTFIQNPCPPYMIISQDYNGDDFTSLQNPAK